MSEILWDEEAVNRLMQALDNPNSPESAERLKALENGRERSQEILDKAIRSLRITESDLLFTVNARI